MSGLFMMRRILLYSVAIVCLFSFALLRSAYAESLSYVIQDVEVSATAANATTARMNALSQAESEAFRQLMGQLLAPEGAAARIASTKEHQISRLVRGYEIHDEKVGSTSYAATLDVAFDQTQVEAFLRQPVGAGAVSAPTSPAVAVPSSVTSPPAPSQAYMRTNVLVLPVLTMGEQSLLWEANNIWRNAWNAAERTDTQFIRLPLGDHSDRIMMDAAQAVEAPFGSFSPIAERYQAATVIVAEAFPTVASGVNALGVRLRKLGMQAQDSVVELRYEQDTSESQEELLQRAAQDVIRRIMHEGQEQALEQGTIQDAPRGKLTVLSRLDQLSDWVTLRKRLMELPIVEKVELSAISNQQVDMVVYFYGSPVQLEQAMVSQGLKVGKAHNYWVVGF